MRETAGGTEIPVRVAPNARRSAIAGLWQRALKVGVAAPPRDERANDALVAFMAGVLGVARRDVAITRGLRGRDKIVRVRGCDAARIRRRFAEATLNQ
ncbi:MAG TPA: DUF167 domain-containing protein [Planctomycetota bacterium]|nr:DUF167 domain-containing protein [Planctomycetota bacterium]HNU26662.1 DUF167 domain-containing protein [Planctomycetota bacterium]HOE29161.1 DUF167 domain-containing protein [Planctomycetota bacterium]HOE86437.1 DUF167 domain-containing protein [Planctomycetota bacterium]HOR66474.1 DUF167 domain-containing protein [Planctomycetota bacterium]